MNYQNDIINKKIIILIAHPNDEILWFGAGIISLCQNNQVTVYCLTHSPGSERGEELTKHSIKCGFKVVFDMSNDPGRSLPLIDYESGFKEFLKNHSYAFDLLITHPFWGNESLHPHNIQAYHLGLRSALQHGIHFSYFSEIELNHGHKKLTFGNHFFKWKVIFSQFYILKKTNSIFSCTMTIVENILLDIILMIKTMHYSILKFECDPIEKMENLVLYKSRINIIKTYRCFYRDNSFLLIYMLRDGKGSPFSSQ